MSVGLVVFETITYLLISDIHFLLLLVLGCFLSLLILLSVGTEFSALGIHLR